MFGTQPEATLSRSDHEDLLAIRRDETARATLILGICPTADPRPTAAGNPGHGVDASANGDNCLSRFHHEHIRCDYRILCQGGLVRISAMLFECDFRNITT